MAVGQTTLTVEEFWEQHAYSSYELIDGRVIETQPEGYLHGATLSRTMLQLGCFVDDHELGDVVGAGTGFLLSHSTLRAADAAYVSSTKLTLIVDSQSYLPYAPDLALEVVSPNDTADEIQQKAQMYLNAGTEQVWVMYPKIRQIVVHYPDGTTKRFTEQDTIDGGSVLPGFSAAVTEFFPPQRQPDIEE
jgi:Uma2 family endonuclease